MLILGVPASLHAAPPLFLDEEPTPWYEDADGDGFGNPAEEIMAEVQPGGYVGNDGDCDDTDDTVYPGAEELEDGLDNNCNGQVDEGFTQWREITDFTGEPANRHENAFVKVGDKFVLLGGRNSQTKHVDIYDPALNAWTKGALHPLEMHHFQGVALDGLVYVIGAFTGDFPDEVGLRQVFMYDLLGDRWFQGPSIPEERVRGATAAVAHEGKIYVVSGAKDGHRSGHVPWLDVFDPRTNSWTSLPDAPRARDHFFVELWGDKIVVAGGRRSKFNNGGLHSELETAIDVYDISDSTWTVLPTALPTQRAGAATALIGDEIFVIGGETGDQQDAFDETEGLNLTTLDWTLYDFMNEGRHGTQAITCNEVVYLAAGSRLQGSDEIIFNDPYFMEKFSPTETFLPPNGIPITGGQLTGGAAYGFVPMDTVIEDTVSIVHGVGSQALVITDISFEGTDRAEFRLEPLFDIPQNPLEPYTSFEPFVLAPGDSLSFRLVFTPSDATAKDAYFVVEHSGSNSPEKVFLTATSCAGPITPGSGNYQEASGSLMMEAESQDPNGWTANAVGGQSFYTWEGGNYWGAGSAGVHGYLSYPFDISTPGTYRFQMYSLQGDLGNPDAEDDIWINFPDAASWSTTADAATIPLNDWQKVYQNDLSGWSWETYVQLDGSEVYVTFTTPGTYHLDVSGRSNGFSIDKFVLYTGTQNPDELPESMQSGTSCLQDWYLDNDNDGFGDPLTAQQSEGPIPGYVGNSGDCNDFDITFNPNAADPDDGLDNNCDGEADEGWVGSCDTLRINAGSDSAFVSPSGVIFGPDNLNYYSASIPFGNDTISVANTQDSVLYYSERTVLPGQFTFTYQFPVVNGPYTVRLHFAEIYHGVFPGTGDGVGKRLINVSIEDTLQLQDYDIVSQAGGPATAVVEEFETYVSDNQLEVLFSASVDNPKVSAIEIIPSSGCGRPSTLPVEFLSFEARPQGTEVLLNWATASELNNDRFIVERAGKNGAFESVLEVPSQGNSQAVQFYQAVDTRPFQGKNTYRIKQIDLDGSFSYSAVVEVNLAHRPLQLYPNPVRKGASVKVAVALEASMPLSFDVYDMTGRLVNRIRKDGQTGPHVYELDVDQLGSGTYLLLIRSASRRWTQRLIVLE